jgi:hypothetical protein
MYINHLRGGQRPPCSAGTEAHLGALFQVNRYGRCALCGSALDKSPNDRRHLTGARWPNLDRSAESPGQRLCSLAKPPRRQQVRGQGARTGRGKQPKSALPNRSRLVHWLVTATNQ